MSLPPFPRMPQQAPSILEQLDALEAKRRRLQRIADALLAIVLASVLLIALLLPLSECRAATRADIEREVSGAFERSEWTRAERRAFTLSVLAHSLDLASSLASDERCVERNPLLGSHPSDGALIATKLLALGFEFWLYSSPRFRHAPTHMYGYTSALIHGAVAASNFRNDCY